MDLKLSPILDKLKYYKEKITREDLIYLNSLGDKLLKKYKIKVFTDLHKYVIYFDSLFTYNVHFLEYNESEKSDLSRRLFNFNHRPLQLDDCIYQAQINRLRGVTKNCVNCDRRFQISRGDIFNTDHTNELSKYCRKCYDMLYSNHSMCRKCGRFKFFCGETSEYENEDANQAFLTFIDNRCRGRMAYRTNKRNCCGMTCIACYYCTRKEEKSLNTKGCKYYISYECFYCRVCI